MSTDAHHEGEHPLIPYKQYVGIWAVLILLTATTVGVSYLQLANITIVAAMVVATIKASLVMLYFMHLRYEKPVFLYMLGAALFFFTICLGLTFVDYSFR